VRNFGKQQYKDVSKLGLSFEYNEMNTMTLTRTLTKCYMTLEI